MTRLAGSAPGFVIRTARTEDAQGIAIVKILTWREAYHGIVPAGFLKAMDRVSTAKEWRHILEQGDSTTLVAESGGAIIGFCSIGTCRDGDAAAQDGEIWALYVSPVCWDLGVGRELWLAAGKGLAGMQMSRVRLWVLAGNQRGIRFYEKAGFHAEAESEKSFQLGGTSLQEIRYSKNL